MYDIGFHDDFLNRTPKAWFINLKIDQFYFIKIKKFYSVKDTVKNKKPQIRKSHTYKGFILKNIQRTI